MGRDRKAYNKIYCAAHKAELVAYRAAHKARKAAYYKAHKAEHAASGKAWSKAHKVERAAYMKAWREANKTRLLAYRKARYEAHKTEDAARDRAWSQANPDKKGDARARRRALKHAAFVDDVNRDDVNRADVYKRDHGRCHICGKKVLKKGWHLDHIIPLARGGEHSYRNVAVSCPMCNKKKGVKAGAQLRLL